MIHRRGAIGEFLGYLSVSVGMALACGGYAILGHMFAQGGGPPLLLAIAVAALLCLLIALAMGELSSMFPSAPGIRTYLKRGLGDSISVGFTVLLLLLVMTFAGIEGHMLALAVRVLIPDLPRELPGLAVICGVTAINLMGVELPRRAQVVMTLFLVFSLAWASASVIIGGTPAAQLGARSPVTLNGFAQLVVGSVFLFTGFEWVAPLGRQPDAYRTRIPLAMCAAVLLLAALFAGLVLALDRTGVPLRNPDIPHVMLATSHANRRLLLSMMIGVSVFSAFTTLNAGLMGMARLVYALAREGVLARSFAALSPKGAVPRRAVLGLAGGALVVGLFEWRFELVLPAATACGAIYCWVYGGYLAALARLRTQAERRTLFASHLPGAVLWSGAAAFFLLGCAVAWLGNSESRGAAVIVGIMSGCAVLAACLRRRQLSAFARAGLADGARRSAS